MDGLGRTTPRSGLVHSRNRYSRETTDTLEKFQVFILSGIFRFLLTISGLKNSWLHGAQNFLSI
jgi:hypothetical protein